MASCAFGVSTFRRVAETAVLQPLSGSRDATSDFRGVTPPSRAAASAKSFPSRHPYRGRKHPLRVVFGSSTSPLSSSHYPLSSRRFCSDYFRAIIFGVTQLLSSYYVLLIRRFQHEIPGSSRIVRRRRPRRRGFVIFCGRRW